MTSFTLGWKRVRFLIGLTGCLLACAVQSQPSTGVDWRYTVRPQDTVSELARQYLKPSVSWQAFAQYNRLPDADIIYAGTKLRMPLAWLAVKQAQAKLTAISGDVKIQWVDGTWRQAQLGDLLQTGQQIQVGSNSSARLQFADASELVMQPRSSVAMDTLSVYAGGYMADTQLRLQEGRVEVHANPQGHKGQKFEVITPAAVASVRGTRFLVETQGGRTLEQTTEGQVVLQTDQGSVMVDQGYSIAVKVGEKPLAPEIIRPAPQLKNPLSKFVEYPIDFSALEQTEVSGWIMQVGRDAQMAQLVLTQQPPKPYLDAGDLANGNYFLRAWSLDMQGIPSQPAVFPFEVAISRTLQGSAIQLPPNYFAGGSMALNLAPLAPGQRYLVQITRDAEGHQTVWRMANSGVSLSVPAPAEQEGPCYLWVWVY
jgi:LysM repeat protein